MKMMMKEHTLQLVSMRGEDRTGNIAATYKQTMLNGITRGLNTLNKLAIPSAKQRTMHRIPHLHLD